MKSPGFEDNYQPLETSTRTILCVDDENKIISALKRQFRNSKYSVVTTTDPQQAVELLDQHNISVVISDYRMPVMTGLELLAKIKEKNPSIVRLLLTGESNLDLVVRAINEGAIFKFISKPWDREELNLIVDEAYEHYEQSRNKERLAKALETSNVKLSFHNRELEKVVVEKSDELIKVSLYDDLTGLPNRSSLTKKLSEIISNRKVTTDTVSVIVIGMDGFKRINDSSSSILGNEILCNTAQRLVNHARSCDLVGRLSDDRFCVILNAMVKPAMLDDIVQRLLRLSADPITVQGKEVYLTASIGISTCPDHGSSAGLLLNHAETAANIAKDLGGNQFCHFSSEYKVIANARLSLEAELRDAIRNEEFVLYFQPRICSDSGKIIAAEGLIRWIHPKRGMVPPDQFIPIMEDTGLIDIVSSWIISQACDLLKKWSSLGLPKFKLSINLTSSLFINPEIDDVIKDIADNYDTESVIKYLELEITEGVLMEDIAHTRRVLSSFRNMGISLAIDDFGTGYSSLNYLVKFPVNYLKIDKSFIDDLGKNKDVNSVVRMMILLAQGLRMRVVAEGVETTMQADALRVLGCDEFQGYLYSKPLPEEEFIELLQTINSSNPIESDQVNDTDSAVAVVDKSDLIVI